MFWGALEFVRHLKLIEITTPALCQRMSVAPIWHFDWMKFSHSQTTKLKSWNLRRNRSYLAFPVPCVCARLKSGGIVAEARQPLSTRRNQFERTQLFYVCRIFKVGWFLGINKFGKNFHVSPRLLCIVLKCGCSLTCDLDLYQNMRAKTRKS